MSDGSSIEIAHSIVAIAQRVKDRAVRTGANVVALLVLAYALVSVVDLARI